MTLDRIRKASLIVSAVFLGAYAVALAVKFWVLADVSSAVCCLAAALSVTVVGISLKRYRTSILMMAGGILFWVIGDLMYLCIDLIGNVPEDVIVLRDFMYRCTSYMFILGLIIFIKTEYRAADGIRLFSNALIFSVGLYVISGSIFFYSIGKDIDIHSITGFDLFQILMANFIILLIFILLAERGLKQLSLFGVLVFSSVLLYGLIDVRYTFLDAAGLNPESLVVDVLFDVSFFLLACAFSCSSVAKFLVGDDLKVELHKASYMGEIAAAIMMGLGMVLWVLGATDLSKFMMLLITGMAYYLVSKTLQAYELNKELLARQKVENTILHEQVTHQQEELATANEKLELATYLDSLTGLWNRVYWNIYYNDLISANPDVRLVLFSLDINFFKMINDTYGHTVGDKLLREFGKRIATFQTDDIRGFRIGGDQFMISCVDVDHGFNVVRFSDRLLETLSKPYIFDDKEIHVAANIGGAVYPDDTDDMEKLMNYAEFARNTLKHTSNVSSCVYYKDNFMPKLQRRFMIEQKLQEINYDTDLLLYYQPQVVASTGEVIGIEALVRWKDPEWGILSPLEFIPVAEEMGIMSHMGEWITTQAMQQIATWNRAYNTDLMMGINVSPVQFQDEFFVDTFLDLVTAAGVEPEWIDIEVTEGIALNRNARNEELIERLREAHISVSVDDFGTGYASFHNMLSFHFDRIKIARELIEELSESEDARVVVEAIIHMAKGMNLTAVAEGVETQEELDILIGLGCEQCQGFFFGRPMPAADFEEYWLRQDGE